MQLTHHRLSNSIQRLNFSFDPFEHWEASSDPNLPRYLVSYDLPTWVWEDHSLVVSAPVGGGKTALRIYASLRPWGRLGSAHPLPVPISPQAAGVLEATTDSDIGHLACRSLVESLFIGLSYRPERVLGLTDADRDKLFAWFANYLPANLGFYHTMLCEDLDVKRMANTINHSYHISELPSEVTLKEYCRLLGHESKEKTTWPREINWPSLLVEIASFTLEFLEFNTVHFLVDGVDAFSPTGATSAKAWTWLSRFIGFVRTMLHRQCFVKCFIPDDMTQYGVVPGLPMVHIHWTTDRLVQLLRRRLYVGSDGHFDSFDALSEPGLQGIEQLLVDNVDRRLPREVIVLAEILLSQLAEYPHDVITREVIEAATRRYRKTFPSYVETN